MDGTARGSARVRAGENAAADDGTAVLTTVEGPISAGRDLSGGNVVEVDGAIVHERESSPLERRRANARPGVEHGSSGAR